MKEKVCPICKIKKSVKLFGKYFSKERNKYRVQNYCNDCQKPEKTKRSAEYYQKNKVERLKYAKQYREKYKNKCRILNRKFGVIYRERLQDCYVADMLAQKWGMPVKIIRSIPGLIESYRANILLKRTIKKIINEKQNRRPKKSFVSNNRRTARSRKAA